MKVHFNHHEVTRIALASAVLTLAACGPPASDAPNVRWEEFKAASERIIDGRTYYVVEWDLPIDNERDLRAYYESRIVPSDFDIGMSSKGLIVNLAGGDDDVWTRTNGVTLKYCISDTFGANKARAQVEMDEATTNWQSVTNVNFVYLANEDATCDPTNPDIDVPVQPWAGGGACAFFPSGGGCVPGTLVINFNNLDTDPFYQTNAPNVTTTGVFRHELGHVMGFRHEHTRPESGTCFEDMNWRELTPYDASSVMHYPWCNGVLTSDLSLTTWDRRGAIYLYKLSSSVTSAIL